jgi:hypothetical protein
MNFKRVFLSIFLFSTSVVFISCSEEETTAPPTSNTLTANFSDIKAKVFVNCTDAQCHSAGGNSGGLVLESSVAFNNLVGVQSNLFPQFKRVEAGSSANSLIIKILRGEVSPQMPFNRTPLPAATIDSIAKWIDNGALNN